MWPQRPTGGRGRGEDSQLGSRLCSASRTPVIVAERATDSQENLPTKTPSWSSHNTHSAVIGCNKEDYVMFAILFDFFFHSVHKNDSAIVMVLVKVARRHCQCWLQVQEWARATERQKCTLDWSPVRHNTHGTNSPPRILYVFRKSTNLE